MPSLRKALKEIAMEKDAAVVSRVGITHVLVLMMSNITYS